MAIVGMATNGMTTVGMVTWWDESALHGPLGLFHNVLENLPFPLSYQRHRSEAKEETGSSSLVPRRATWV